MKKFLSLLLSFVMVSSLFVPALATTVGPANNSTETTSIYLSEEVRLDISINRRAAKSNDTSASFEVTQFNNDQLRRRVSLSDDGKFLLGTEYADGVVVRNYSIDLSERIQRLPSNSPSITPKASSKEYLIGNITYKPVMGGTTNERLKVYCDPYLTDSESYVVNGKATDTLTDIAGLILSIIIALFFPAEKLALKIASAIVGFYSGKLTGEAIGVAFSEEVSVISKHYNFRAYKLSTGIYSSIYPGVSRRVTTKQSKYYGEWFYEGITPETWKVGDEFAIMCWNNLYNEYYPGVKSYT